MPPALPRAARGSTGGCPAPGHSTISGVNTMNCTLRRGLLSTLFAGGLLAFGCATANAADTTSGTDLSASALISAAAPANSTSLGLLGDPTPAGSAGVAAAANVNLGLGGITGPITSGTGTGTTDGTATNIAVDANVNLGLGSVPTVPAPA